MWKLEDCWREILRQRRRMKEYYKRPTFIPPWLTWSWTKKETKWENSMNDKRNEFLAVFSISSSVLVEFTFSSASSWSPDADSWRCSVQISRISVKMKKVEELRTPKNFLFLSKQVWSMFYDFLIVFMHIANILSQGEEENKETRTENPIWDVNKKTQKLFLLFQSQSKSCCINLKILVCTVLFSYVLYNMFQNEYLQSSQFKELFIVSGYQKSHWVKIPSARHESRNTIEISSIIVSFLNCISYFSPPSTCYFFP